MLCSFPYPLNGGENRQNTGTGRVPGIPLQKKRSCIAPSVEQKSAWDCCSVFNFGKRVVPTYKILRTVLCLYDLPCQRCKSIAFTFCHPVSSIFSFKVQHRTGASKISAYFYRLSFTVYRCCRFSFASISGGIWSTNLFSFACSILSFHHFCLFRLSFISRNT